MKINWFPSTHLNFITHFALKFVIQSSSLAMLEFACWHWSDRNRRTAGLQWLMRAGKTYFPWSPASIFDRLAASRAHSGPEWIITPALSISFSLCALFWIWWWLIDAGSPRRAGICSSIIHTSFHELTNNSDLSIDSLVLFRPRCTLLFSIYIREREKERSIVWIRPAAHVRDLVRSVCARCAIVRRREQKIIFTCHCATAPRKISQIVSFFIYWRRAIERTPPAIVSQGLHLKYVRA